MERNTIFAISLITIIVSAAAYMSIQTPSQTPQTMSLHTDGRYLKDAVGNVVVLRGVVKSMNFARIGQSGDDSGWAWYDAENTRAHLRAMRDSGFTCWRLFGWNFEQWLFPNGTSPNSNRQNWELVRNQLDAMRIAKEEGLYVVYAPYSVAYGRQIEGNDLQRIPFPPYLQQGTNVISSEQDFTNVWVKIATEIERRNYNHVLFELYNEPNWVNGMPNTRDQAEQDLFRVYQNTINAIRQVSDNPIIIQWRPGVWWNSWTAPTDVLDLYWINRYPLTGTNLVYSTHLYRVWGGLGQIAKEEVPYDYVEIKTRLQRLFQSEGEFIPDRYPLFIGEVGCSQIVIENVDNVTNEHIAFNNILTIFDEWKLGYTVFTWKQSGMFRIFESGVWIPQYNEAGRILVSHTHLRDIS